MENLQKSKVEKYYIECGLCYKYEGEKIKCYNKEKLKCMKDIKVEKVYGLIRRILQKKMNFGEIYKSQKNYFKWRIERIGRIEKRFPELFDVKGKRLLDIGCGAEAPLSYYLSEKNAKVWGGEIDKSLVKSAKKFARKAKISCFAVEKLPFKDEEFDIVYLWDVLEHVKDPEKAIKEAKRVTKKGGLIFIEFSPYFAYPTGHHLYCLGFPKGFLPFQFMPLFWTKRVVLSTNLKTKDTPKCIFKQFKYLNKLTIAKFKKIVKEERLEALKEFYFISLPNKEIKINFVSIIPIVREFVTMSYSGLFRKSN